MVSDATGLFDGSFVGFLNDGENFVKWWQWWVIVVKWVHSLQDLEPLVDDMSSCSDQWRSKSSFDEVVNLIVVCHELNCDSVCQDLGTVSFCLGSVEEKREATLSWGIMLKENAMSFHLGFCAVDTKRGAPIWLNLHNVMMMSDFGHQSKFKRIWWCQSKSVKVSKFNAT